MEQQLINVMMKLISKAGGGIFIKEMIKEIDQDGNPKTWTQAELINATEFLTNQIENFGTAEAIAVIETLVKKYNLDPERFLQHTADGPGAKGLQ